MEYFLEWGYFGLFLSSFLAATVLPLSSELVLSVVLAKQYSLCAVSILFWLLWEIGWEASAVMDWGVWQSGLC